MLALTAVGVVVDETAAGVLLEAQADQPALLEVETETDLLVVLAELAELEEVHADHEEPAGLVVLEVAGFVLEDVAGLVLLELVTLAEVDVVHAVHEEAAGVVEETFTGVVVVVATVVELAPQAAHEELSTGATAAAEAAPAKAAAAMKDFILTDGVVLVLFERVTVVGELMS